MNQKITFPELIDLLAQKQRCSKREAENFLRELMTLMTETVSSGESLRINSLGVFKPVWVEERVSVNVQTGEPYTIPGHYKLTFTPVKAVREAINEPFSCFVVEVLPDDTPCIEVPQISDEMPKKEVDIETDNIGAQDEQPVVEDVLLPETVNEGTLAEESKSVDECVVEQSEEVVVEEHHAVDMEVAVEEPCVEETPEVSKPEDLDCQPELEAVVATDETAEKFDETVKKAYRKGLWIGLCVALVLFLLLALGYYFYRTSYQSVATHMPVVHHGLVADTIAMVDTDTLAVVEPLDTLAVAVEPINVAEVVDDTSAVVKETVSRGVFLTNISLKHYGHKAFWVYIYEENKDIIPNPDNVAAGTVVVIPPAEKYAINAADTVAINKALKIADEIKKMHKK